MKKQIINKETGEVILTLSLPHSDPEKWAKALKVYQYDHEIEYRDIEEIEIIESISFWSKVKSFLGL